MALHKIGMVVAGLGIGAVVACCMNLTPQQALKQGATAPEFTGKTADGKEVTRASFLGKTGGLIYFINHDCPVNADAVAHFNKLASAYAGKVGFIGVINGDKSTFTTWQKKFNAPFPVVLDPDLKIIRAFKAQFSPWAMMVSKEGKIAKVWQGYSSGSLLEINQSLAAAASMKAAVLKFPGAPDDASGG